MTDESHDQPVLSGADRALLKSSLAPTAAQLAATRRAIGARAAALAAGASIAQAASSAQATGAAASGTAAATTAAATATKGLAAFGAAKWISAGLIITAVTAGTVVATRRSATDAARPSSASEAGPPLVPPNAPIVEDASPIQPVSPALSKPPSGEREPAVREAQPVAARAATTRTSSERKPARTLGGTTLSGELALLHDARQALERRDSGAALQALDAHTHRYPNAVLRQEALSARALALCEAGRTAEARRAAAQLARIAPRSPHLIRLADSCALADTADSSE